MTDEEIIQEAVSRVLATLKTNGRTINQLTAVQAAGADDYIELNGGRRISFSVLTGLVEEYLDGQLDGMRSDIAGMAIQVFSRFVTPTSIGLIIKQAGHDAMNITLPLATEENAGLLSPSEKDRLNFDETPTAGSTRGVTSGGILSAISTAKAEAIESATAADSALVKVIDFSELDNMNVMTYQLAETPTRYTVKTRYGTRDVVVGVLDILSDSKRHVVTQVFTTHYVINSDGQIDPNAHWDTKLFTYFRSAKISGGSIDLNPGEWTKWQHTHPPMEALTQESYDLMVDSGTIDPDTYYFIYEN